jgi:DNA-binding NarL/FixJ family response regulator
MSTDAASRNPSPPIRVLLAEDQVLVRDSLKVLIDTTPGLATVGEAGTGAEAVLLARLRRPDVVLMDVRMPDMDGIEVAHRLQASHPDTLVVLISVEESIDLPSAAKLGASVPLVRKQDFGPRLLRELWGTYAP